MIAKKIQSNICGMLNSFRLAAFASYDVARRELRADVHIWFNCAGHRAQGPLAEVPAEPCTSVAMGALKRRSETTDPVA